MYLAAAAGTRDSRKAIAHVLRRGELVEHLRRRLRPDARHQLQHAKARHAAARIFHQRSSESTSLTCPASRNLRPPNLTKGMLRRVSSISSARYG